uniref:Uncharacterized protein n=1 Tax=Octopus bimaculoides TaxID=37653 RepID=A0A0L8G1W8_OCTBM
MVLHVPPPPPPPRTPPPQLRLLFYWSKVKHRLCGEEEEEEEQQGGREIKNRITKDRERETMSRFEPTNLCRLTHSFPLPSFAAQLNEAMSGTLFSFTEWNVFILCR